MTAWKRVSRNMVHSTTIPEIRGPIQCPLCSEGNEIYIDRVLATHLVGLTSVSTCSTCSNTDSIPDI